jgi:hypothetical protein
MSASGKDLSHSKPASELRVTAHRGRKKGISFIKKEKLF